MSYLFSAAFFKKTLKYLQGKYKMILSGGLSQISTHTFTIEAILKHECQH